jgi:hypothetical protein
MQREPTLRDEIRSVQSNLIGGSMISRIWHGWTTPETLVK